MNLKIFGLLLIIIISGCADMDSKVEVIPNLEWDYLKDNQITEAAIPINKEFENELKQTMYTLTENWCNRNGRKHGFYRLAFTIYIGETGKVEKIKDGKEFMISNLLPKTQRHPSDTLMTFDMDSEIVNEILQIVEEWEFTPANFVGVTTKYQKSFGAFYKISSETNEELELLSSRIGFFPNYIKDFFVAVEEMPEPIGGMKAIQQKIKYPEIAKKEGIQGRVYVKAFVDEKGKVVETEVLKGIGGGCDQVAIKAVEATLFKPGRQKGKAVKVQVSIPILFKLN